MTSRGAGWALAALIFVVRIPAVHAHEVLHTIERGKAIAVKAFFGDGEVLAYTEYQIFSPTDPRIPYQKGRTDRSGYVAFVPDAPGAWRVKVTDTTGHGLDLLVDVAAPGATGPKSGRLAGQGGEPVRDRIAAYGGSANPGRGGHCGALCLAGSSPTKKAVHQVKGLWFVPAPALFLAALPAYAHHGVAAVGLSEPEGPGAALETTAALPLPKRFAFAMVALGFGITPWLSAYLFQPYNVKSADGGIGHNPGLGDTNLMLSFGWKWDEGPKLIPRKESLDELADWHFLVWASCTLPVGPTEKNDNRGDRFAPDMQTGFGTPSPALGLAVLRQFSTNFTALAEVNHQRFFTHDYSFTRYRFGAETRANASGVTRIYAKGRVRLDGVVELVGLHLQRDREDNGQGSVAALSASGGTILYGSLGARLYLGRVAIAIGAKRAVLKSLNEASDQQGSEGLENIRVSLSLSVAGPL